MLPPLWVDRGQVISFKKAPPAGSTHRCVGVARLGSVQTSGTLFTLWAQLRGSAWVDSKDGRFRLSAHEWIAFEKDSVPHVTADRNSVCIGIALGADALQMLSESHIGLYAGRGSMSHAETRVLFRLWRAIQTDGGEASALRPLLLHIASLQSELAEAVQRCPGRSRQRRQQVFGRMQRARQYLEGNSHRVVRIDELAELTSFSSCYLTKTFQSLYAESPQSLSSRMRLDRAAQLLRDTDMLVSEVASASGFDNNCSFARAFRQRFGVTAREFRG